MQHTANCTGSVELPVGSVPAAELQDFTTKLRRLIAKAEERERDERSSLGSKRQGHQKTPAMVLALSRQALAIMAAEAAGMSGEDVPECTPRGGTTDVGLHTGGTPCNTAWPLVREAFKVSCCWLFKLKVVCVLPVSPAEPPHQQQFSPPADHNHSADSLLCPPHLNCRLHWGRQAARLISFTSASLTSISGCCSARCSSSHPPPPPARLSTQPCRCWMLLPAWRLTWQRRALAASQSAPQRSRSA